MEYLEALRRYRLVALLVVLAVVVPTVLAGVLTPREYTATTQLWVGVGGGKGITDLSQKVSVAGDLMSTYPELVRSPLVLRPVVAQLGLSTDAAALSQQVVATVPNDTLVLDIQVTDRNPVQSAKIANAVAEQFRATVSTLPQVRTGAAEAVDTTVLQEALPPASASSPLVARDAAIALVLGLVLAIIVCLVITRYRPDGGQGKRYSTSENVPVWD